MNIKIILYIILFFSGAVILYYLYDLLIAPLLIFLNLKELKIKQTSIPKTDPVKIDIALQNLSKLWEKENKKVDNVEISKGITIPLGELVSLYRDKQIQENTLVFDRTLQNKELNDFFHNVLYKYFNNAPSNMLKFMLSVVLFLDQYCKDDQSVVDVSNSDKITYKNDRNKIPGKTEFDYLKEVSLIQHLINTALIIEKTYSKNTKAIKTLLLCALLHDIGKSSMAIRELSHDNFYATGDHFELGVILVETDTPNSWIQGFSSLQDQDKEAIVNVIKNHQRATGNEFYATAIQRADKAAREQEYKEIRNKNLMPRISEAFNKNPSDNALSKIDVKHQDVNEIKKDQTDNTEQINKTDDIEQTNKTDNIQIDKVDSIEQIGKTDDIEEQVTNTDRVEYQKTENIFIKNDKIDFNIEKVKNLKPDISWLDPEKLLNLIKDHINVVNEKRFEAFSMSNGMVYVQPGLLSDIAIKMGIDAGDSFCIEMSQLNNNDIVQKELRISMGRALLLEIVNHFKNMAYISENDVQNGFFAARYKIISDGGILRFANGKKELIGTFIPFLSGVFSVLPSDLEKNKHELLRRIRVEKQVSK